MTESSAVAVLAGLPDVRGWVEDFYRDLHQHPELSHAEQRTGARVAERLRAAGFEVHDGVGGTGVVGVLANGAGRTVLRQSASEDFSDLPRAFGVPYCYWGIGGINAAGFRPRRLRAGSRRTSR